MATTPAVPLDAEGERLRLEAQKAKYAAAIATSKDKIGDAQADELRSLLPADADAPKGEVALGDRAGAFGPWRAHHLVDVAAGKIARSVAAALPPTPAAAARVLVVDDRSLLAGAWTAQYVRLVLERQAGAAGDASTLAKDAQATLEGAIAAYRARDATPADADEAADVRRMTGSAAAVTSLPAAGALGAAVDLLGLLRTDYTVTAMSVTTTAGELSTLVAAKLSAAPAKTDQADRAAKANQADQADQAGTATARPTVEADAFTTTDAASRSTVAFSALAESRRTLLTALTGLAGALAPVTAEIAALGARITTADAEWGDAVTAGKTVAVRKALRGRIDDLVGHQAERLAAAGPAQAVLDFGRQVIADLDAAVAAVLAPSKSGEVPLYTAIRRERLDAGIAARRITHVVYVHLDSLTADAVTRRSVLGASGRIQFLAAANASWLVLDTSNGAVVTGGQVSPANAGSFDVGGGPASYAGAEDFGKRSPGTDWYAFWEFSAKAVVVLLVLVLVLVGVVGALALLTMTF